MSYQAEFLPFAKEELADLPRRIRRQVARKIDALREDPHPEGSKALKGGGKGLYRVRSGHYRILYRVRAKALVILVVKVGDRKDIYRGL